MGALVSVVGLGGVRGAGSGEGTRAGGSVVVKWSWRKGLPWVVLKSFGEPMIQNRTRPWRRFAPDGVKKPVKPDPGPRHAQKPHRAGVPPRPHPSKTLDTPLPISLLARDYTPSPFLR